MTKPRKLKKLDKRKPIPVVVKRKKRIHPTIGKMARQIYKKGQKPGQNMDFTA